MNTIRELKSMGWSDDVIANAKINGKPLCDCNTQKGKTDYVIDSGETVVLVVHGDPVAKPRMTRRDKWAKRTCVVKYREWCSRVRALADGNIPNAADIQRLDWIAYFEPAASWPKKRRREAMGQQHRQTPDRDNIDKAVLDALFPKKQNTKTNNDSMIARGMLEKYWDWEPRIVIRIYR